MATLQQTIAEKFLASLASSGAISAKQIEQLRELIDDGKKVKADDIVKIFTASEAGDVT
jgi:hypothetical protein